MAAKAKIENLSTSQKINDFIQRNRKALLVTVSAIVGGVIIFVAVVSIRDAMASSAFNKIDEFERRYQNISISYSGALADIGMRDDNIGLLLEELDAFAKKNSGYVSARAYALSANIFESLFSWSEAEYAWTNAAVAASRTYLGPVAYFNAAAAAEEQGNFGRAIDLYNKVVEYGDDFYATSRAQFSIGRIYETMGDRIAAIAAYQTLVSRWSGDNIWSNLAHSRILALSIGL